MGIGGIGGVGGSGGLTSAALSNLGLGMLTKDVFGGSPEGSPLVVPPGPLATAAFESGLSAVEELRLLKTQVQDVSRVCQAVARGDLSQKITVPVQGVVMVQLKDVINTMVGFLFSFSFPFW